MDLDDIYRQYLHDIYRYLYSLCQSKPLAEDLMQDTFYKAHFALLNGTIQDIKPWLFKVAYYTYIDHERKNKRITMEEQVDIIHYITPESQIVESESFQILIQYLNTLSFNEKHAIILCDVNGCSHEEAAAILNLKINTIKSHLFRGRRKMRELIKEGVVNDG
ncbi:sigma-70 family RNA polymerase sigma factor [Rummeliibacillus pycnus]|uniref:sigma-70 family RNA polymerase sigma factor n=1 Tax=Rummeliibacillus pycnus TaxID=101070 RepID=UPI003D26AFC1